MTRANYAVTAGARIPHNGDPFFPQVLLLLHEDGPDGAVGDTGNVIDSSSYARVVDTVSEILFTDEVLNNGATTMTRTGSSFISYLTSNHPELKLGTSDLTCEVRWQPAIFAGGSDGYSVFGQADAGAPTAGRWWVGTAPLEMTRLALYYEDNIILQSAEGVLPAGGVGDHLLAIAYTRRAGVGYLFVDGVLVASGANAQDYSGDASFFAAGNTPVNNSFNGWQSEFRLTGGVARYTQDYTPRDAPFPNN